MRWALFGAVAVLGCQQMPPVKEDVPGLGGGVVPASYAARPAVSGDFPVNVTTPATPAFRRVSVKPRPRQPEPVALGHAADYRWIVGVLARERGRWMIRYDGDRHGGMLELLATGPMEGFSPGGVVRVEGDLVDPLPYEIRPGYRVRSMNLVGR